MKLLDKIKRKIFTIYFTRLIYAIFSILILLIIFYFLFKISINTNIDAKDKYGLYVQIGGAALTLVALYFTYRAIRISQSQKNYSVRPIVVVSGIDIYGVDSITNSLDFHVVNEGVGIALNINVKVTRLKDKREVFNQDYMRLNVIESPIIFILNDIRNQLIKMNSQDGNGLRSHIYSSSNIFVEHEFTDNEELYHSIMVTISFSDIYEKLYRNTFTFNYDVEEKEYNDGTESHVEI